MDLSKYEGENIVVIDKNGMEYKGYVDVYIPDKDNDIDEDCICLDTGTFFNSSDIQYIRIA